MSLNFENSGDMLVNLITLPPEPPLAPGIRIKRAMTGDMEAILTFIRENFSAGWVGEASCSLHQCPSRCFIATEGGKILGFACYDSSALDFFGPTGVLESRRGEGIGGALLLRTLHAMRADGYAYAIIGWVGVAAAFYEKTVGARYIPGGDPLHSVYHNMVIFP